jgi:hypothetical protein
MARAFKLAFEGESEAAIGTKSGFFSWVDGAPASGYRAPRTTHPQTERAPSPNSSVTVVTGEYGAMVLEDVIGDMPGVEILAVHNSWFGGNIAVTGLLVGADIAAALDARKPSGRVLVPDVCLSQGLFLDGTKLSDLPIDVEVVPTDGLSLRRALVAPVEPEPVLVTVGARR